MQRQLQMQRQPQVLRCAQDDSSKNTRVSFGFGQDDNSKQRQEQMQRQPQVIRFAQDDNSY
jgi:hypothetical protein